MEIIAMPTTAITTAAAITPSECGAVFVSLELSRSTWLVTALAAPLGGKMSRHQVRGGDVVGRPERFPDLQRAVRRRTGLVVPVIVIQEARLDGFRIHRALVAGSREPCGRTGLDRGLARPPPGQDGPDRR